MGDVSHDELLALLLAEAGEAPEPPTDCIERRPAPAGEASFAQQRLWFLDQLGTGAAYHIPMALRLQGPLDAAPLERALVEIARRHESLRSTFRLTPDGLEQVVGEPSVAFLRYDLSALATAEGEERLRCHVQDRIAERFDLGRDAMLRAVLFDLGGEPPEHVLLLVLHHIAGDGWSMGVLMNELATLYGAFAAGRGSPLPDLPVQYADFARWHRRHLTGERRERLLAYWRRKLEGIPPAINLPTDRPRPLSESYNGSAVDFVIPATTVARLAALGTARNATPFMVLLALFATLLARLSQQDVVVIGSPIAHRTRPELDGLIGFFANTLALRIDLSNDPSIAELLDRVRQTTLEAYDHQDLPFEELVAELQPDRGLERHPLFQVMLAVHNQPSGATANLPGLTVSTLPVERRSVRFDLELHVWESGPEWQGTLVYSTALFERATAERFTSYLCTLLAGARDASLSASAIPLTAETAFPALPAPFRFTPDAAVHRLFRVQAARTPDRPALEWERADGRTAVMSYGTLDQLSGRLALRLTERGIGAGSFVGICIARSPEMVAAVLGILRAGAACVPLDPGYPPQRLAFMVADAAPALLLTDAGDAALQLPGAVPVADLLDGGAGEGDAVVTAEDACYLLYTSGSTGQPKGVVMPHRALANLAMWQIAEAARPDARTLQFAPISFDTSFQEIVATLCAGGTLCLPAEAIRRDPEEIHGFLARHRVERVFMPYVALQQLAEVARHRAAPASLREVITAGEALRITPAIVELFERLPGCRLVNQYGPTESHVATAYTLVGPPSSWPQLPPIGAPVAGTVVRLLDRHGRAVPVGVPGQIHIGGAQLCTGYLGRPDLNTELFYISDAGRLYHSGDLGRLAADGNITFLGRSDGQVKVRGYRVEPGEIEATILRAPDIAAAAVAVRKGRAGGERLLAYVVPAAGADADGLGARVQQFLVAHLPDYMLPAVVITVPALPKTPSGKIDFRALPSHAGPDDRRPGRPPATETERGLATLWAELLGVGAVGADDDFFALGGHSLLAVHLMAHIRRRFGRLLPLGDLFRYRTVAALAARLSETADLSDWPVIVPLTATGRRPPVFFVPGAGGNVVSLDPLARVLGEDQPFYGFQARGLDGFSPPHDDVEPMAEDYIGAVRAVQPHGPYWLGGHSFGGKVAFAMAQRLLAEGEPVAPLLLLDCPPPGKLTEEGRETDDSRWLSKLVDFIGRASDSDLRLDAAELDGQSPDDQMRRFKEVLEQAGLLPVNSPLPQVRGLVNVFKANVRMDYAPDPTATAPVPIILFAVGDETGPLKRSWSRYGPVTVRQVSGTHMTMLSEPHVRTLGASISACLKDLPEPWKSSASLPTWSRVGQEDVR